MTLLIVFILKVVFFLHGSETWGCLSPSILSEDLGSMSIKNVTIASKRPQIRTQADKKAAAAKTVGNAGNVKDAGNAGNAGAPEKAAAKSMVGANQKALEAKSTLLSNGKSVADLVKAGDTGISLASATSNDVKAVVNEMGISKAQDIFNVNITEIGQIIGANPGNLTTPTPGGSTLPPPQGAVIFKEDFETGGLTPGNRVQNWTTNPNSFQVVHDAERGLVGRISMNRNEVTEPTRSRVELVQNGRFQQNKEYSVQWGVKLDTNYQFDSKQSEIIGQIHQSSNDGSPPFAIVLKNDHYYSYVLESKGSEPKITDLGPAIPGKWEDWRLDWKASPNGDGYYQLYRGDQQVLDFQGNTSYNEPDAGYFKLGMYKWDWPKNKPSDVTNRTLFIDDVAITERQNAI